MPTYLCYLNKAFLMYTLAGAQCCINILFLAPSLDREDTMSNAPGIVPFPLKYSLSAILLTIATALVIVARYVSTKRLTAIWSEIDKSGVNVSLALLATYRSATNSYFMRDFERPNE